jgi:hypothetical protein
VANLPPVSLIPMANILMNDDLPPVSMTPVANLPPVSTTPEFPAVVCLPTLADFPAVFSIIRV